MTPEQMVGYALNQTSALTAIVSTRIYSGNRPAASIAPCVNYFPLPGGKKRYGFERVTYSFNCRAQTEAQALQIMRIVDNLFNGSSGTGIYGDLNSFEISRASEVQMHGAIFEPADNLYNAPVDILFIYPSSSIS